MRFRIKSGQSARRFVFDRTPAPAKPLQPSAPRAAAFPPAGRCRVFDGALYCQKVHRFFVLSAH